MSDQQRKDQAEKLRRAFGKKAAGKQGAAGSGAEASLQSGQISSNEDEMPGRKAHERKGSQQAELEVAEGLDTSVGFSIGDPRSQSEALVPVGEHLSVCWELYGQARSRLQQVVAALAGQPADSEAVRRHVGEVIRLADTFNLVFRWANPPARLPKGVVSMRYDQEQGRVVLAPLDKAEGTILLPRFPKLELVPLGELDSGQQAVLVARRLGTIQASRLTHDQRREAAEARAAKLTAEQRAEIARKAAAARWGKPRD